MKKALFLSFLLACSLLSQAQVNFIYNGRTYQPNDTITLYVAQNAHSFDELYFQSAAFPMSNAQLSLEEIERNTLEVWALCSGDACVSSLTSAPFDIPNDAPYEDFSFDLRGTEALGNYAVYTLTIGNASVVVRFEVGTAPQGISEVRAAQAVPQVRKIMYRNRLYIERNGVLYDLSGRKVK